MPCLPKRAPRRWLWRMKTDLTQIARAKVNLSLHVTGQRADGYHLLDSLVVFADIGDVITLTPGPVLSLSVSGPFAEGVPGDARNLVWRAAELAGWSGHITLEKHLPHGGGIGGGSSDAATVLRLIGADVNALALGADVPVCLRNAPTRMRGIGEDLTAVSHGPGGACVLVNPGVHVPTPEIFARLALKDNPPMPDLPGADARGPEWVSWLAAQRNDLQAPAIAAAPEIGEVLCALEATQDALLVRMSGSGSTCFALYPGMDAARAAQATLRAAHPGWWCAATTLS